MKIIKALTSYSILLLFFMTFPKLAISANYYIRDGGSGNGTSWSNALDELPSTLVRGDTYYIADGFYPSYTFDTPESGSAYITIKKATEADHGTDIGWDGSYGDGVAEWQANFYFKSGYWIIDGVTGTGNSGHGFRVKTNGLGAIPDTSKFVQMITTSSSLSLSHITFSHTEIAGPSEGIHWEVVPRTHCLYMGSINDAPPITDITISHCYMHDTTCTHILILNLRDSIIEHCYFERRLGGLQVGGTDPKLHYIHGESIPVNACSANANLTFRYNVFKNIYGTGALVIKDSIQGKMYIYGNLFYQSSNKYKYDNGVICNTIGDTNNYMYVYNNTFVNCYGAANMIYWDTGANNVAENNLFYNCSSYNFINTSHHYNLFDNFSAAAGEYRGEYWSEGGELFVDYSEHDYHLALHTETGRVLPHPYDQDMDGIPRGSDDVWDRGAYQCDIIMKVKTPKISLSSGTYKGPIIVKLSCSTVNALIYYTTDDTEPTQSTNIYNDDNPLVLIASTTLKARAFKNEIEPSDILTASFTIEEDKNPPIIEYFSTISDSQIALQFNEQMDEASSLNKTNYDIDNDINIEAVSLSSDKKSINFFTTQFSENNTYTFTVNNVQDLSGNPIESNTQIKFVYIAPKISEGLIGYWNFDEGTGSIAYDWSGHNNNGTINGASWSTGIIDHALNFNLSDDYVDLGAFDVEPGINQLSISVWFKADYFEIDDGRIISKASGTREEDHYFMLSTIISNNRKLLRFRLKTNEITTTLIGAEKYGDLVAGQWIHAVAVYDSSYMKIYKDSKLVGRTAKTGTISTNSNVSTWIGSNPPDVNSRAFNGHIDDVRIYNIALSEDQIIKLNKEITSMFNSSPTDLRIINVVN